MSIGMYRHVSICAYKDGSQKLNIKMDRILSIDQRESTIYTTDKKTITQGQRTKFNFRKQLDKNLSNTSSQQHNSIKDNKSEKIGQS